MFLRLGGNKSVRKRDIVGIFDIDDAFTPKDTQAFLRSTQDGGRLSGSEVLPKSFVLTASGGRETVILTGLSAETLCSRFMRG